MNSIIVTEKQLKRYSLMTFTGYNNNGNLYRVGSKVYKIFKDSSFIDEKKRNIKWLLSQPVIEHTTYPEEKIMMDTELVGYSMTYLDNCLSFRKSINSELDLSIKVKIIRQIFSALKEFHQRGVILGDIHLDNFIHNNKEGFIADLEELRFPGDEFKFRKCYCLKSSQDSYRINCETKATDNIKTTISALTFLLGYDFETFIKNHTVEDLNQLLLSLELNLQTILNCNDAVYFDEVMEQYNFEKAKQKIKIMIK